MAETVEWQVNRTAWDRELAATETREEFFARLARLNREADEGRREAMERIGWTFNGEDV